MKYAVFVVVALGGVPLVAAMAYASRWGRGCLLVALVFSTALGDLANINFLSIEAYRGPDRGLEINLTDLLALGVAAGIGLRFKHQIKWVPFNTLPMFTFWFVAAASIFLAPQPLFGLFTLFKLAKFFLIYWCALNLVRVGVPLRQVGWGLVAAAGILTLLAFQQKYLLGLYRVHATFDHSNTVSTYANLALPPLLAIGLADDALRRWGVVAFGAASVGLLFTIAATFSRAGVILAVAAVVLTVATARRAAPRTRFSLASLGVLLALGVGSALAADSMIDRFTKAPESSGKAREEFNVSADMMLADHPLGVGLNNFSFVLTETPAYRAHLSVLGGEEQAGVAHHIYRLTAAETGYLGLTLFLLVMARFTSLGVRRTSWSAASSATFVVSVGIALCSLHLGGLLEWTFRTTPVLYLFGVLAGAAVSASERLDRRAGISRRVLS